MDLNAQVLMIRERWQLLLDAAAAARVPEHTFLNVISALLAVPLARQPEHVAIEWVADLNDHIKRLRKREVEEESG